MTSPPSAGSLVARLVVAAAAVAAGPALADGPDSGQWHFNVLLDGKPIGRHRFDLVRRGEGRELLSRADFRVRLLGIPAYRYLHRAAERWTGDCLARLEADTDDNGQRTQVRAQLQGGALQVERSSGVERLPGCTMTYAYWHPGLVRQSRLLNAQTGAYEPVRFETVGTDGPGRHVRVHGPEQPIDLWYGPEGDWLALESKVSGGRRTLRYERMPAGTGTD